MATAPLVRLDGSLLYRLLDYIDTDDLYSLWVYAEECGVGALRDCLALPSRGLSRERARLTAALYSCWTALRKLTKRSNARGVRLSPTIVSRVLDELRRLSVPLAPHPDRETAMMTVAAPFSMPESVIYAASRLGNMESIVWLHHVTQYDPSHAVLEAGRNGHAQVISWILENAKSAKWISPPLSIETTFHISDDPELGLIAWRMVYPGYWHDRRFVCSLKWKDVWEETGRYPAIDLLASHGDLEGVRRLLNYPMFTNGLTEEAFENAAHGGHLEVLKLLYQHWREEFGEDRCLHFAAISGHLHVVQWLAAHEVGGVVCQETYEQVIQLGHLSVLKWLLESNPVSTDVQVNKFMTTLAARAGHTEMVKWLIQERGCEVIWSYPFEAAEGGHLELVQWLLDYRIEKPGQPAETLKVSPGLLSVAAKSRNCELVRWLVEVRGLWSPYALLRALASGSLEAVEYLLETGKTRPQESLLPEVQIYTQGWIYDEDFDRLKCLLQLGYCRGVLEKADFDRLKTIESNYAPEDAASCVLSPLEDCYGKRHSEATRKKFREFMELFISVYDPDFVRSITWLPKWAVQYGTVQSLARLASIGHSKILKHKYFRLLLRGSTDDLKVRWFLRQQPSLFTTRVVNWAIKYDKGGLQMWLFRNFLAQRRGTDVWQRCMRTATRSSKKLGRPLFVSF